MQEAARIVQHIISRPVRIVLAILLILTFSVPSVSAFAVPTSAEKQAEADEAYAKLQAAESEAFAATEVYYKALDEHDAAVAAMAQTQALIDEYKVQIADRQDNLSTRVASMYRNGQTSYLDVLFGARTFMEFISVWDLLTSLNDQDAQLISEIKELRQKSEQAYEDYAVQEALAKRKLGEADAAKVVLEEKAAKEKALYDSLSEEVALLLAAEEEARQAAIRPQQDAGNGGTNSGGGGTTSFTNGGTSYSSVAGAAQGQVGKPYDYGATGPNAFDCSGLVYWSYLQCGLTPPPRSSGGMYSAANGIYPVSSAQYGDILYTDGHVGISLGGNEYVHASDYGTGVIISHNASSAFDCVLRF